MSSQYLAQCLLVFLLSLVYADLTYSKLVHYITSSPDGPCPQNSSCLTLSQFAANTSDNETDISLLFLPGNHTLNEELFLAHLNNFSMTKDGLDNETVFVECSSGYGRFHISETLSASINEINFIGCGSNSVSHMELLTITDSTFQGIQDESTVLVLIEISAATIDRSSFLSNVLEYHNISRILFPFEVLDYVYLQRITPRGILYTALCNVSIINTTFMNNRANIGGALVADNSHISLSRNTYSYNTANFGGVMVTSGSTIDIDNSIFVYNVAHHSGGVMVTNDDTFTIRITTFTFNNASIGGVIIFHGSTFTITSTIFSQNSADLGGVICDHPIFVRLLINDQQQYFYKQ